MGPTSHSIAPLIVVMAYNRPASLARLLASMAAADIDGNTDVIISIDGGGSNRDAVAAVASEFRWPNGDVEIRQHKRLGLVGHFHRCGDLTGDHGSVVLLEDDLVVGPNFHRWATEALTAASVDDRVAGVCLAAPWFDGYRHLPFEPLLDGSAGLYLQIPWFHGMAWTDDMWSRYRRWLEERPAPEREAVAIHRAFAALDEDEWFPDAVRYLADSGRYYLLPRQATVSNTGAAGQHFAQPSDFFQVPIQLGQAGPWSITGLDRSLAVYDDHMEPTAAVVKRLCPELDRYDLTVDLLGVRDPGSIRTEHVLTIRPVATSILTWGTSMRPMAMNLVGSLAPVDRPGGLISLAETRHVRTGRLADLITRERVMNYGARGRPPGLRTMVAARVGKVAGTWLDARTH